MQLEIEVSGAPADHNWRQVIELHCSLTLRPLGQRVRRIAVTVEKTSQYGISYFVSDVRAKTSRSPVHVRTQHASANHAIALAFARARRELLRQFGF